jgi:hypothetical protein
VTAVDNHGRKYSSYFCGNSNSKSTCFILETLANILDKENRNWRYNTIIMMDRASYHRSKK